MEFLHGQMERNIKANGMEASSMGKEF